MKFNLIYLKFMEISKPVVIYGLANYVPKTFNLFVLNKLLLIKITQI